MTSERRRVASKEIEAAKALDDAEQSERRLAQLGGDSTFWVQALEAPGGPSSAARGDELRAAKPRAVGPGSIEPERELAEAAEKDRRMVGRLAEIHNDFGVHGEMERTDAEYAAAFQDYGVDLHARTEAEAGARLASSPVAAELANALDQWVFLTRRTAGTRPRSRGSSPSPRRPTPTMAKPTA